MTGSVGAMALASEARIVEERRLQLSAPATGPFTSDSSLSLESSSDDRLLAIEEAEASSTDLVNYPERIVERARMVAARKPNSARARTNYGLALLGAGLLNEAEEELTQAQRLDSTDYLASASLARTWVAQGRLVDARALLSQLLGNRPTDANVVAGLADIADRQGELRDALGLWSEACRLRPQSAWLKYRLGITYLRIGRKDRAIAALRAAAGESVRSPLLHHGLGIGFLLAGSTRRAIRSFQAALTLAPRMRAAEFGLAATYLSLDMPSKAAEALRDYLEENAGDREAREFLALSLMRSGDPEGARRALSSVLAAISADSSGDSVVLARIRNNLGVCAMRLRRLDIAEREFASSIELAALGTVPYHNLARTQYQQGRENEALRTLEAVESVYPGDPDTRILRAVCLEGLGKSELAISDLRAWTEDGSATPGAWSALGDLLCDISHDVAGAISVMEKASQLFPRDPMVANNFAYVLLMAKQPDRARQVLESFPTRFLPKAGSTAIVLVATRGLLALREGDPEIAEAGYRAAAEMARSQGSFGLEAAALQKMHLELGRWWAERGSLDEALRHARDGLRCTQTSRYRGELEALDRAIAEMRAGVKKARASRSTEQS